MHLVGRSTSMQIGRLALWHCLQQRGTDMLSWDGSLLRKEAQRSVALVILTRRLEMLPCMDSESSYRDVVPW